MTERCILNNGNALAFEIINTYKSVSYTVSELSKKIFFQRI